MTTPNIIEFLISPDGQEVEVEAKGTGGASCVTDTADYERALGKTGKRQLKPEYHLPATGQKVKVGA